MKISVVIPSYNRATFLVRTIESVVAQIRQPDEILVVDDGSQDDTESVIRKIIGRGGELVRYLYRTNGGLSAARNTGMANANSECNALLFLDSDDLLDPTALVRLERALSEAPDAPLAFCRARYINMDDQPLIVPNTALVDEPPIGTDMWRHLLNGNCIRSAGGVLIRRDALRSAGPFDETMRSNEDWDMWLRLAQGGRNFARVPEPLLLYRIHGNNMSGNRAVMRATGLRVYEKQKAVFDDDSEKVAAIEAGRAIYLERDVYEANQGAAQHVVASPLLLAATLEYDATAQVRHRKIRNLMKSIGIVHMYRKTPMEWRLRLRTLFGIDPNA